jgi:hypothetical protein
MLSFLGFPIGGLAALTLVGAVDSTTTALVGGAITGATVGAIQSLASPALPRLAWIAASSAGLSVGLATGATAVGFDTSLGALAWQGAISGAVVGGAQAAALVRMTALGAGRAAAWPPFLAACWALGWTITTSAGVDVERQYTVFGAAGAIVVTALTALLPLSLRRRG